MPIQLDEKRNFTVREHLSSGGFLLRIWRHIHTSPCARSTNHTLAYPLRVYSKQERSRKIWEISNRREAIIHEEKKTNSNSSDYFKQCRLRSKLTLRSRNSREWGATATNAANHTEPTSTAN